MSFGQDVCDCSASRKKPQNLKIKQRIARYESHIESSINSDDDEMEPRKTTESNVTNYKEETSKDIPKVYAAEKEKTDDQHAHVGSDEENESNSDDKEETSKDDKETEMIEWPEDDVAEDEANEDENESNKIDDNDNETK